MQKTIFKKELVKNLLEKVKGQKKVPKGNYFLFGKFPIVDQGAGFINGYINDEAFIYKGPLPVIVFGDHTCRLKFLKHDFCLGADGTQLMYTKKLNQTYFYYALKNLNFKISSYQRHYKLIKEKSILFPNSKDDQNRIASTLSSYDDLIENNEKRIKILEEMAQLLYTEWFVKFKFPGHEKVKLVDSGTEFGMIPEGWEVKKLSEIGRVVTGKTPPTSNPENLGGEVLFIKTPDMHGNIFVIETEQTLSEKGVKTQSSKLLPERTVFVSCIGTLGVVGITSVPSQTNQQINSLVLNDMSDYCMFYFFAKSLRQKLVGLGSNGATMGNVNKGKFENILIIYPEKRVRSCFFNKTSNLFNEILLLQKRNKNLSQIRDLLIPQLVTGKRELK